METNETILTRDVVVIDSRKKLGSIKALRVDCDTRAVSHYIVNNDSTGSALVLPFDKALAVGDTFITVQNRDDFLATNDTESAKVLQDGYVLLKEEVFTKTGNKLSPVKGFEFDTVYGTVSRLDLQDGTSYASDTFLFFSPDFVFIDDGASTAAELRVKGERAGAEQRVYETAEQDHAQVASTSVESDAGVVAQAVAGSEAKLQVETEVETKAETEVEAETETETEAEASISDSEIKEFLTGTTLNADVESEDGRFKVAKGTVLTQELIDEAEQHDVLLLLTINVEV